MISPNRILEIGTFTGYSTICLAEGLPDGGLIHTIEVNDELEEMSNSFFEKRGILSKDSETYGQMLLRLFQRLNETFELVFIDGDKREYSGYYDAVFNKVAAGGYILADNVLWGGKVTDRKTKDPQTVGIIEFNRKIKEDQRVEKVILPVRDGITIIRKKR